MELAERYDRFGDEIYERWDVDVRHMVLQRTGVGTGAAACPVSIVYCWLNRENSQWSASACASWRRVSDAFCLH